ncbi:hypothetical protein ACFLS1_08105 [Verrucomicrobiota bacterium]
MTDWQSDLGKFFEKTDETKQQEEKLEMDGFVSNVVMPAFNAIEMELAQYGRYVNIRDTGTSAAITVFHKDGEEELMYRVQGRTFPNGVLPYAEIRFRERKGHRLLTVEAMFRTGNQGYLLADITKDEVIQHFISHYTKRVQQQ